MKICKRQQTNLTNNKEANHNFTKQSSASVNGHFDEQGKSS